MQPSTNTVRKLALVAVLATLGGCSEYLDRRDSVALSAGNAIATDKVTLMVDPWPRASANRNIAFDGNKMQSAVERYRTNRVIAPRSSGTTAAYAPAPDAQATATPTQPTTPVK